MPDSSPIPDESRLSALLRRADQALFVLNRRRRVIFANGAWEKLVKITAAEACTFTCTARETGHTHSELAQTLAPPPEVLGGAATSVRRALPGKDVGPPWWDIDYFPIVGEDRPLAVICRIRQVQSVAETPKTVIPSKWAQLRGAAVERFSFALWESGTAAIQRAVNQARLVVVSGTAATLIGPSGVGKRAMARTIHAQGGRRELPCLCLACECLPADAVRDALLRHDAIGLVYLHDPGAMPRDVQNDLVRNLIDRTQLIIGCPRDPELDVKQGRMSEEMWSAATVAINLPPLADRLGDLPQLVDRILHHYSSPLSVSPEALEALRGYSWPGNLDELSLIVHTAAARAINARIELGDLPIFIREPGGEPPTRAAMPPLDQLLEQIEVRMMQLALLKSNGNRSKAAELLGIWRPRLVKRLDAGSAVATEP